GDIRQIDTFFDVDKGRLKLRESDPGEDYLVFYRRPDMPSVKACDYLITPASPGLKGLLAEAFGITGVVSKTRTLWLWKNVRIHIDSVDNLGEFIEFEAVLSEAFDDADGTTKLAWLSGQFGIHESDLLPCSYLDMALA
ncbi:MAG: class IV adenylate cyclase, partial [Candidatus Hydrogenedentales bacterium]